MTTIGVSATPEFADRPAPARVDVSGTNAYSPGAGISTTSEKRVFETGALVVDPGDPFPFPEATMDRLLNPQTVLPPAPATPGPLTLTSTRARRAVESVRAACPDTRWAA
ncbi:hypothetical protein [Streptomyces sp. CL12]|uniref:hypothetical protein n=1 Tax=Streptomyces sp. CL12 TaxID=3391744 RepID=UPI003A7F712B